MTNKTSLLASRLQTQKQGPNTFQGFKTGPIQQTSCSGNDLASFNIFKETLSSSTSQQSESHELLPELGSSEKLMQSGLLQLIQKTPSSEYSTIWGLLIGIINKRKGNQNIIKHPSHKIRIGIAQEFNALSSIRPHSLDSLVVFWDQNDKEYPIQTLLRAKQRLIIVHETLQEVNSFLEEVESTLLRIFGGHSLVDFADKLCFSFVKIQKKYIIQFLSLEFFEKHCMRMMAKRTAFRYKQQQMAQMINLMTVEDYMSFLGAFDEKSQIDRKQVEWAQKIEQDDFKTRQQMEKKRLVFGLPETKSIDSLSSEAEKYAKMDTERQTQLEVDYFSKEHNRISQETKETKETNEMKENSKAHIDQNLFYFIQEHDSSQESEFEADMNSTSRASYQKPARFVGLTRSKSHMAIPNTQDDYIDEQFFTKY